MRYFFYLSGCWELNPGLTHPMRKYYHYTTARSYGIILSKKRIIAMEKNKKPLPGPVLVFISFPMP